MTSPTYWFGDNLSTSFSLSMKGRSRALGKKYRCFPGSIWRWGDGKQELDVQRLEKGELTLPEAEGEDRVRVPGKLREWHKPTAQETVRTGPHSQALQT